MAKKKRKKSKNPLRQIGDSNPIYDLLHVAKKPGKRKSASGKTYYERRKNRSDRNPKKGL